MKQVLLFVFLLSSFAYMLSCTDNNNFMPPENNTENNTENNIVEIFPEQKNYTGEKVIVDVNSTPEKEDEKKAVVYTNPNGNIANGGIVLNCGDYLYYDVFVEDPENEYTGGAHSIFKVKSDFSEPATELFCPYFQTKGMLMIDDKLYFSSGGGGGRYIYEVDTESGEHKTLHDNFHDPGYIFADSLYYYDGFLYIEVNGSIYRMKPDQSEFEVLLEAPPELGIWLMGVENGSVFYWDNMNGNIHRLDESGDNIIIENYMGAFLNIYGRRLYYLNSIISEEDALNTVTSEIVSCDFDGLEKRTVIQFKGGENIVNMNVTDGYIYYTVNNGDGTGTYSLCEYNINGGEKRVLYSGDICYNPNIVNGKLYHYSISYGTIKLRELDLETLALKIIE